MHRSSPGYCLMCRGWWMGLHHLSRFISEQAVAYYGSLDEARAQPWRR